MANLIRECDDVDPHNPGRYSDPNTPVSDELLRNALDWMSGIPDFVETCDAIREELLARCSQIIPA
jgi:hypothetical protein